MAKVLVNVWYADPDGYINREPDDGFLASLIEVTPWGLMVEGREYVMYLSNATIRKVEVVGGEEP